MKERKTPFPILVHVLEGQIDFGLEGETSFLDKGAEYRIGRGHPSRSNSFTR